MKTISAKTSSSDLLALYECCDVLIDKYFNLTQANMNVYCEEGEAAKIKLNKLQSYRDSIQDEMERRLDALFS